MKSVIFKSRKNIPSLLWRALSWQLNFLWGKTPRPLACGLYLTSKCNFRCDFCNIWRKANNVTLPFAKARKIVDGLSDSGCFYFSITGGEPLLVDYIFDLLSYAKKSKIRYVHMVTNGYLLNQDKAGRLKNSGIDELSISIDGCKQNHDKRRGVSGAYSRAIEAIENLKKKAPQVNIVLNAVFFPQDPLESLHVLELARKLGVAMKVQPLNQHPLFNQDNSFRLPSENNLKQREQDIKRAIKILRDDSHVVNSNTFLDNIYNFYFQKDKLIFSNSDCLFGYHHIEILEDGRIFPCLEGLNWQGGIEFDGNLKTITSSQGYAQILKNLKKCKGCRNSYYICYYEPRISFPLKNFIRFNV